MDNKDISKFLVKMEGAMTKAGPEWNPRDPDRYFKAVNQSVEEVAKELEPIIRAEGLEYPTANEPRATARTLLWAGWMTWIWTAKAGRPNPDTNAQRILPIFEGILKKFIAAGSEIGQNGRRPEQFLASS